MKTERIQNLVASLFLMLVVAGCATAKVEDRDVLVTGHLPRPDHILVYDFAATGDDVPSESAFAGQNDLDTTPLTAEEITTGRKLGAEIATELVTQISNMGLAAEHVSARTQPQIDDIVIRGYLLSIKEGSEEKRVGIGFGAGASELKTAVEGFQVTAQGLRRLGSGDVDATGNKTPGTAFGVATLIATHNPVGLIVSTGLKLHDEKTGGDKIEGRAKQTATEIADLLKKRFQEQGWIQ